MAKKPFRMPTEVQYDGMTLLQMKADAAPLIKSMKTTEKDIYVVAYPRSGTTWISEIVDMIKLRDTPEVYDNTPRFDRVLFLEMSFSAEDEKGIGAASRAYGQARTLMTHMPYRYLKSQVEERTTKLVYVMRNVRDVFVSLYYFYQIHKGLGEYRGTWSEFFEELCKQERLLFGDWLDHVKGFWEIRHLENVHVVFYEDAVDDLKTTVNDLAKFMGVQLSEEELNRITAKAQFDYMKANADRLYLGENGVKPDDSMLLTTEFFWQGKYGNWKNYFTEEQDEFIKEKYDKALQAIGINFKM